MTSQEALNKIKTEFGEDISIFGVNTDYVSVNLIYPKYIITFNAIDGECYVADPKMRDHFFKTLDEGIEYIKSKIK